MRVCCVICRELFLQTDDVSATLCGHTFHTLCIIQWLERSKSCPQCRTKATEKSLMKLFFDDGTADGEADPEVLQQQFENMKFQLKLKEQEAKKATDAVTILQVQAVALREEYRTVEERLNCKDTTILALKTQIKYVDRATTEAKKAKVEVKEMKEQLKLLKGVEMVLSGSAKEVATLVNGQAGTSTGAKSLASFVCALKIELKKALDEKTRLYSELRVATRKSKDMEEAMKSLTSRVELLQEDNESLEKETDSLRKKIATLEQAIASPSDDVRSSALHRLLYESPAPALLRRLHCGDAEDSVTPEVVRKKPGAAPETRQEEVKSLEAANIIDLIAPPRKKPKAASSVRPLSDSLNILKGNKDHYSGMYAKASTSSGWKDHKLEGRNVGYDGLGGHHRVDVFPKPGPLLYPLSKAKKPPHNTFKRKPPQGNSKTNLLTNYLKNTFED